MVASRPSPQQVEQIISVAPAVPRPGQARRARRTPQILQSGWADMRLPSWHRLQPVKM